MNNEELYHYGVLGMKWGVRRYQNYDGTYTKKGLEHYKRSEQNYEAAKQQRKAVQRMVKDTKKYGSVTINGRNVAVMPGVAKEAKQIEKQALRNMKFNYKQLKKDYLADKGKELYSNGKTISGNYNVLTAATTAAGATFLASNYLRSMGRLKHAKYALYAGAGLEALMALKYVKNSVENRRLRAYYGHSARYKD